MIAKLLGYLYQLFVVFLHCNFFLSQNDEKKRKQDELERLEAEEARDRAKKLEEWV